MPERVIDIFTILGRTIGVLSSSCSHCDTSDVTSISKQSKSRSTPRLGFELVVVHSHTGAESRRTARLISTATRSTRQAVTINCHACHRSATVASLFAASSAGRHRPLPVTFSCGLGLTWRRHPGRRSDYSRLLSAGSFQTSGFAAAVAAPGAAIPCHRRCLLLLAHPSLGNAIRARRGL